jgi:hypothetical protein
VALDLDLPKKVVHLEAVESLSKAKGKKAASVVSRETAKD